MKNKITQILISCLMLFSLMLFSCSKKTPSGSEGAGAGGKNWWDKFGEPQYGGTITLRISSLAPNFDVNTVMAEESNYWYESLWNMDWTTDRNEWAFKVNFLPEKYMTGLLAESWELPDGQTIIVHLKKGVKWHDKQPVNGREFTADDVVQHYKRGWTNPIYNAIGNIGEWDSVTATDKYTVVFKFKKESGVWLLRIADTFPMNVFEAPEWAALGNRGQKDWRNTAGTGAWILTDCVYGTSMTYSKNPDYYGFDQRYPKNRLPYADRLKLMCIPDTPTALAALRTGKIDILGANTGFGESGLAWRQSQSLKKSNPDLQQGDIPSSGPAVDLRCDRKPFNDINVRKALQMAINRKSIAQSYYGGTIDGTPCGYVNPALKGYAFAYEDWPQKLKDEYSYNPEKAKQLLKDAGYPTGFRTDVIAASSQDKQLLQIIQSQFKDINVVMDIKEMDATTYNSFVSAGKHDAMVYNACGFDTYPTLINHRWSKNTQSNWTYNNDPVYDKIHEKFSSAIDPDKAARLQQDADKRAIEMHWSIDLFPTAAYIAWQPYLKGYSGEMRLGFGGGYILARLWIDQKVKGSMGR